MRICWGHTENASEIWNGAHFLDLLDRMTHMSSFNWDKKLRHLATPHQPNLANFVVGWYHPCMVTLGMMVILGLPHYQNRHGYVSYSGFIQAVEASFTLLPASLWSIFQKQSAKQPWSSWSFSCKVEPTVFQRSFSLQRQSAPWRFFNNISKSSTSSGLRLLYLSWDGWMQLEPLIKNFPEVSIYPVLSPVSFLPLALVNGLIL